MPGSGAPRHRSASTTDASAWCSSRASSAAALSRVESVRRGAGIHRHATAKAATRARQFDGQEFTWEIALADPEGGTLVCHNDVCPRTSCSVTPSPWHWWTSSSPPPAAPSTTSPTSAVCVCRSKTNSTRSDWAGGPPTGRHAAAVADAYGLDGDGRTELLSAMDDALAHVRQPSGTASRAGDPTRSPCGTGQVAASATTAGAAGGSGTARNSPRPCADTPTTRHAARHNATPHRTPPA